MGPGLGQPANFHNSQESILLYMDYIRQQMVCDKHTIMQQAEKGKK